MFNELFTSSRLKKLLDYEPEEIDITMNDFFNWLHPEDIEEVKKYWSKKNIPQQWYSNKEPFSKQWFNELAIKRYEKYYDYLSKFFTNTETS